MRTLLNNLLTYTGVEIEYNEFPLVDLDAEWVQLFDLSIPQFAAKERKCKQGNFPCGGRCISGKAKRRDGSPVQCRKTLPGQSKTFAEFLKKQRTGSKKGEKGKTNSTQPNKKQQTKQVKAASAGGLLKKVEFNPHANKDLTVKEFANYLKAKKSGKTSSKYETIEKAIAFPLVDEETAKKYKPFMTEDEANAYTKQSWSGNLSFYHGNSSAVVNDIANDGSKPNLNTRGVYGKGLYLAAGKDEAEYYGAMAGSASDIGILSVKTSVKNPWVVNAKESVELMREMGGIASKESPASTIITEYLRAKGHDSIYIKDLGYFITFDGKQTVTYKNEEYNQQTLPDFKNKQLEKMANYTKDHLGETGKKLASAS